MSQLEKRLQRLLRGANECDWTELKVILQHYGAKIIPPRDGSHWRISHRDDPDKEILTIPVHNNKVKKVYVKKLINLLLRCLEDE